MFTNELLTYFWGVVEINLHIGRYVVGLAALAVQVTFVTAASPAVACQRVKLRRLLKER